MSTKRAHRDHHLRAIRSQDGEGAHDSSQDGQPAENDQHLERHVVAQTLEQRAAPGRPGSHRAGTRSRSRDRAAARGTSGRRSRDSDPHRPDRRTRRVLRARAHTRGAKPRAAGRKSGGRKADRRARSSERLVDSSLHRAILGRHGAMLPRLPTRDQPWTSLRPADLTPRRRTIAYAAIAIATVLPRLVALVHERGSILLRFTFGEKSDDIARTFLDSGTFGFIPGHPSAYTQPLYSFFLIPLYETSRPLLACRGRRADHRRHCDGAASSSRSADAGCPRGSGSSPRS